MSQTHSPGELFHVAGPLARILWASITDFHTALVLVVDALQTLGLNHGEVMTNTPTGENPGNTNANYPVVGYSSSKSKMVTSNSVESQNHLSSLSNCNRRGVCKTL